MNTQISVIELLKSIFPPSQAEAAQQVKVSQPAIHKWLSGKCLPSAKNAVAIERAFPGLVTRQQIRPDIFDESPLAFVPAVSKRGSGMESPRAHASQPTGGQQDLSDVLAASHSGEPQPNR